jgi:hypothetical protein
MVRVVFRRLIGGVTQEDQMNGIQSLLPSTFQRYRIYNGYTTDISDLPGGWVAPD